MPLFIDRSRLSATHAAAARQAVLSFFNAPPDYCVVFTANASAALKLVGESFPFSENGCYVLGADSHNSVHGIRQFATRRGAQVHYVESTSSGGMNITDALVSIQPAEYHKSRLCVLILYCYTLGRSLAPPSPRPSCFVLVCVDRAIKHFKCEKSARVNEARRVYGIPYTSRRCCARAYIRYLAHRHPGRRHGNQLLQDVRLPNWSRCLNSKEVVPREARAPLVCWRYRRCCTSPRNHLLAQPRDT